MSDDLSFFKRLNQKDLIQAVKINIDDNEFSLVNNFFQKGGSGYYDNQIEQKIRDEIHPQQSQIIKEKMYENDYITLLENIILDKDKEKEKPESITPTVSPKSGGGYPILPEEEIEDTEDNYFIFSYKSANLCI